MKKGRQLPPKPSLELIEEAVHLLRQAPTSLWASYCIGSLPFLLGFLYFWMDMSRNAMASHHLAGESLALALLFIWMKAWHAAFAREAAAQLTGRPSARLGVMRWARVIAIQTAVHATGLFLLPVAALLVLPFPFVYSFYQNSTALADDPSPRLLPLLKKAWHQTTLWPGQDVVLLLLLSAFAFFIFVNWCVVCLVIPSLAKTLLGLESVFSRSSFAMFNTTFVTAMFGLTWLSLDPLLKAIYALRCFYGQSRRSGDDLKAELRQLVLQSQSVTAIVVTAFIFAFPVVRGSAGEPIHLHQAAPLLPLLGERAGVRASAPPTTSAERDASGQPHPSVNSATPLAGPVELDEKIQQVLKERKYAWRIPREKVPEPASADKGPIGRFLDRAHDMVRDWAVSLRDKLRDWLRKLFEDRDRESRGHSSGSGWIFSIHVLLYTLAAVVAVALALLLFSLIRKRGKKEQITASQPIQSTPDLADENVGAEQLPEDGWITMGREFLDRGEFRLALRAFYLASLAHLAQRNLISLARFKSNSDYQRELQRRAHSFPDLLALFGSNVGVFDRVWYGLHETNQDMAREFLSRVEQMKGGSGSSAPV